MCLQKPHYNWKIHQIHKINELTQELTDLVDTVDEYAKRMGDGMYIKIMDEIKILNDDIQEIPESIARCWITATVAKKHSELWCDTQRFMYDIDYAYGDAYRFINDIVLISIYFHVMPDAPPYYKGGDEIMPPKDRQEEFKRAVAGRKKIDTTIRNFRKVYIGE